MIGRVVVLLVIGLCFVAAPVAVADGGGSGGGGQCVYTSQSGAGGAAVGVSPGDCVSKDGSR